MVYQADAGTPSEDALRMLAQNTAEDRPLTRPESMPLSAEKTG